MKIWVCSIGLLLASAGPFQAAARTSRILAPFPSRCAAIVPAQIRGPAVQWLGACVAGKADGLGVLRVGARAPFAFLIGRMKAGRPVSGHMIDVQNNLIQARGFDDRGVAILADGEHLREQDQVWADAVRAARSVADRFEQAGNRGSASYYRRFADKIEHGRPE